MISLHFTCESMWKVVDALDGGGGVCGCGETWAFQSLLQCNVMSALCVYVYTSSLDVLCK